MKLPFADLHTHTTASDGLDSPEKLLAGARAVGLSAIAIADHDTVSGYLSLPREIPDGPEVIPAIEMSANVGTAEVHILGHFIDPDSPRLHEHLSALQTQRVARVERFCTRLAELGLPLRLDDVLFHATGESVGRPHIARAMIEKGYVTSVNEAFDRYLGGGRPAFVPRDDITPEWCIELIHQSGGCAALAHPYTTGNPEHMVLRLVRAGLDGLEVEYGSYSEADRAPLRVLAERHGLIPTGGSDYHGATHREDTPLGAGGVAHDVVERLRDHAVRYHRERV